MVRLVDHQEVPLYHYNQCFNSYMVRLVAMKNLKKISLIICFNSYMVRLVAMSMSSQILFGFKFQFLYGAIGGAVRQ